MWILTGLGIAAFIVGLSLKTPDPKPVVFDDGTPRSEVFENL